MQRVDFVLLSRYKRRGSEATPTPGSPDISPLDFLLRGCIKSRVYSNVKPDAREQLMRRIRINIGRIRW